MPECQKLFLNEDNVASSNNKYIQTISSETDNLRIRIITTCTYSGTENKSGSLNCEMIKLIIGRYVHASSHSLQNRNGERKKTDTTRTVIKIIGWQEGGCERDTS